MATNPYYQRAFNAIGGTLARARQMVNEFALIQRGFDLIGSVRGATKYQLSCSDLTSDLETNLEAAYFRLQRALVVTEVRASVLQPSVTGAITIQLTVNGTPMLATPLTLDQGERTSTTAAVPHILSLSSLPDDAEVVVQILAPGANAKGLIVSMIGYIEEFL
jgi:hypothetical protein